MSELQFVCNNLEARIKDKQHYSAACERLEKKLKENVWLNTMHSNRKYLNEKQWRVLNYGA